MASSSLFEIVLTQRGRAIAALRAGDPAVPPSRREQLDGAAPFDVEARRRGESVGGVRVFLGDELLLVLRPGESLERKSVGGLNGEFGEVVLRAEAYAPGVDEPLTVIEQVIEVSAPDEVVACRDGILVDLERIHRHLALDVIARTKHKGGGMAGMQMSAPDEELHRLSELERRIAAAVQRIGAQPSTEVVRTVERRRWRPGVRLRPNALRAAILDPETKIQGGDVVALGRAVVETSTLSTDIGEHRQIRAGVDRLRGRCRALAKWCIEAGRHIEEESERWGDDRSEESIYRKDYAPRLERMSAIADRARALDQELRALISSHDFLHSSGGVRTMLAPTPLFLNRPEYREAYGVLRELARAGYVSFTGDELRLRFKSLSRLYEYWCFVAVVRLLADMFHCPIAPSHFHLVDDLYRPDLEPNQTFRFEINPEVTVFATYEPDISFDVEARSVRASGARPSARWVAALSTAPLRPDILVEVSRAGHPPCALVLDAKCRWRFDRHMLWEPSDYRTRIFDPTTGTQPIRQVFFLHPAERVRNIESLPGYLSGRRGTLDNSIIGAVPLTPADTSNTQLLLRRFLELARVPIDSF